MDCIFEIVDENREKVVLLESVKVKLRLVKVLFGLVRIVAIPNSSFYVWITQLFRIASILGIGTIFVQPNVANL